MSGGERSRLAMIKLLLEPVNLLILDEPTNHLDMRTKDVLKEAIREFDGTVILVSHDRDFLDGLVTKVYEFGGGKVREHLGGIYDYLQKKDMESLDELHLQPARPNPAAAETAPKEAGEGRLTYEQQKEKARRVRKAEKAVAECEAAVTCLEERKAALEARLSTPEGAADTTLFAEYADTKEQLEAAETAWAEAMEALEELG